MEWITESLKNYSVPLPSVIILMVIEMLFVYLFLAKTPAEKKTDSMVFFKRIIHLPLKIKKIICIVLILSLIALVVYLNKSGNGSISDPAQNSAAVQKEVLNEENPLPPEEVMIVPEKQVRFDIKDLEELAKQNFPPDKLTDYLILRYFPEKKLYLLVSINELVDFPVEGKEESEFWKNLEEILNQIQRGELPKGSSSLSEHTTKKVRVNCAGILLIDAPTRGIRDNTEKIIQKHFPDSNVETFNNGKKN